MTNNSNNDSPIVFGGLPKDLKSSCDGFKDVVYQCTRQPSTDDGNNINIMHISTDLTVVSDEIIKIINSLKLRNFSVKRVDTKEWPPIHVLIIGGDQQHINNVAKLSWTLSTMFGMYNSFDVVIYKIDGRKITCCSLMEKLWLPHELFKSECESVIHHNIQKELDHAINRGIIADRVVDIECVLDHIVVWNTENKSTDLSRMLKQFKKNIEHDKCNKSDSEIFFAAMNVIRLVRNKFLHGSHKEPNDVNDPVGINKFIQTARKHKRNDLVVHLINDVKNKTNAMKDCVRLATHSLSWIKRYDKRYGKK